MDNNKFFTLVSILIVSSIIIMITLIQTRPTNIKMPDNYVIILNESAVKDSTSTIVKKIPVKPKGKRYCSHMNNDKKDTMILIIDSASVVRIKDRK